MPSSTDCASHATAAPRFGVRTAEIARTGSPGLPSRSVRYSVPPAVRMRAKTPPFACHATSMSPRSLIATVEMLPTATLSMRSDGWTEPPERRTTRKSDWCAHAPLLQTPKVAATSPRLLAASACAAPARSVGPTKCTFVSFSPASPNTIPARSSALLKCVPMPAMRPRP